MGAGLRSRLRDRLHDDPVLIAVSIVVVALLLASPFVFVYVYLPSGCPAVGERPVATFSVDSASTPDGVRVNLTHAGGNAIPADDLYVQAPGTNTTIAAYSALYDQHSSVGPGDTVVLTELSNGSHVAVVWRNQSFEYDHDCTKDDSPYRDVLAEFVVGNEGSYPTGSR